MAISEIRTLLTVIFFVFFVLIIIYAVKRRKSKDFFNASKIPLKD